VRALEELSHLVYGTHGLVSREGVHNLLHHSTTATAACASPTFCGSTTTFC
jgi:hypothetical protein